MELAQSTTEIVASVGRQLEASTPELVSELAVYLSDRIPELRDDSRLRELLRASIFANLTTVCHMLINRIAVEATEAPAAALEYAVRHAQNDMPGSTLVRAYMVGQALLLQRAMDLVHQQSASAEVEQQAINTINHQVHAYTDRVLQTLIDAHEHERRQWLNTRARVRRDTVTDFLRTDSARDNEFIRETDYSLTGSHVAFLVWLPDSDGYRDVSIETQARRVATALAPGDEPLIVVADAAMAWGWVHFRANNNLVEHAGLAQDIAPLRVALGNSEKGPDGFRRSHQQAQDAHLVAVRSSQRADATVVAYDEPDVGIAAILLRDPKSSRVWIENQLGALAANTATARALRETIVAFSRNGQSFSRTAEALGVHRNTVMSRLERYLASRGHNSLDLSEVTLAIRMLDFLPRA